jgi:hypothetical protein
MSRLNKYIDLAKKLNMVDAKIISQQDVFFDIRAILKCRWGCEDFFENSIRCHPRNTSYQERVDMIKRHGAEQGGARDRKNRLLGRPLFRLCDQVLQAVPGVRNRTG